MWTKQSKWSTKPPVLMRAAACCCGREPHSASLSQRVIQLCDAGGFKCGRRIDGIIRHSCHPDLRILNARCTNCYWDLRFGPCRAQEARLHAAHMRARRTTSYSTRPTEAFDPYIHSGQ